MIRPRRALGWLAAAAAGLVLVGCVAGRREFSASIPEIDTGTFSAGIPDILWNTQGQERTAEQQAYGSAGLIAWPTAVVSVYLDATDGTAWDEESIAESRAKLDLAVDWIDSQAARYGMNTTIYHDDGTEDSGLFYRETFDGSFVGGVDGEESQALYARISALCRSLDSQSLHQKYNTSSVAFLFFLPVSGSSYSIVHYLEDGGANYYEYSILYAGDAYTDAPETPAVYAHELLHQYGAPDLYEGSSDYYVTPMLSRYVAMHWPDAIMYDTYNPDGSMSWDEITQQLCPLTAYRLGLCTTFAGLESWPDAGGNPPGTFAEAPAPTVELAQGVAL